MKTHPYSIVQVPTTQVAKMSIDLNFAKLTADVLGVFFIRYNNIRRPLWPRLVRVPLYSDCLIGELLPYPGRDTPLEWSVDDSCYDERTVGTQSQERSG